MVLKPFNSFPETPASSDAQAPVQVLAEVFPSSFWPPEPTMAALNPALALVATWGVNQQVEEITICLSNKHIF